MSLSGDLEDISVVDLLQFVHLGGRSGTLVIERGAERGEVTFYRGRIVVARGPSARRLGDMLVDAGVVTAATITDALAVQRDEGMRRGLGQILVARGALSAADLRRFIVRQIEESIYDLVTWRRGRFVFELDELRVPDDIAVDPSELLLQVDLNTQMLLLEAMRIFDERNRRDVAQAMPTAAAEAERPRTVIATADEVPPVRFRVQTVTTDRHLQRRLAELLPPPEHLVAPIALRDAGAPLPGEPAPAVLLDLRHPSLSADSIRQIRRDRPRAMVVAIADGGAPTRAALEAGAMSVVPPDVELAAASLRALWSARRDLCDDDAVTTAVQAGFAKLRAVFTDLRSGLMNATVSLTLMNAISDAVERAVMFVVRRHELVGLGAFGQGANGRLLADDTRGLAIALADAGPLADALRQGRARTGRFDERMPPELVRLLGPPRTGQIAVFPVAGSERDIAVVYADNGSSMRAIEQIDILELAAAHVGVSFENELLRRRMAVVGGRPRG